jgi:L-threonylcarbamoyladenylate synthase
MSSKTLFLTLPELKKNPDPIIERLKSQQIGVLPTDTIYGIVTSALDPVGVENLYQIRQRTPTKPLIILISALPDLAKFGLQLTPGQSSLLDDLWPNPLSIILPVPNPKFEYLHRGTETLAFRMPDNHFLRHLISETGPLVAPSANIEGQPPATTIKEAQQYFGNNLSFYIDAGTIEGSSSTLISLAGADLEILRQGDFKLPDQLLPPKSD